MVLFPSHNQKFLIIVTRYKAAVIVTKQDLKRLAAVLKLQSRHFSLLEQA